MTVALSKYITFRLFIIITSQCSPIAAVPLFYSTAISVQIVTRNDEAYTHVGAETDAISLSTYVICRLSTNA